MSCSCMSNRDGHEELAISSLTPTLSAQFWSHGETGENCRDGCNTSHTESPDLGLNPKPSRHEVTVPPQLHLKKKPKPSQ